MIEGLKVMVNGTSLRSLCEEQAAFHDGRARFYEQKAVALQGVPSQNPGYTGMDPQSQMKVKQAEHENARRELEFIGRHLLPQEMYLLGEADLRKIGIRR